MSAVAVDDCTEKVAELVNMGFDAEQSYSALHRARGNMERAVSELLSTGGSVGGTMSQHSPFLGYPQPQQQQLGSLQHAAYPYYSATTTTQSPQARGGRSDNQNRLSLGSPQEPSLYHHGHSGSRQANYPPRCQHLVKGHMSQYSSPEGRSACTCIALMAAQTFLEHIDAAASAREVVTPSFLQNSILQGIELYNTLQIMQATPSSATEHLSAEEVLATGCCSRLRLADVVQGMLTPNLRYGGLHSHDDGLGLHTLLQASQAETEWTCVLLTKPPETVLVLVPPATAVASSFILVDSHPRPQQFDGATESYARFHASLDELIHSSLSIIFPCTDLGPDIPPLMAAMYNQFDMYRLRHAAAATPRQPTDNPQQQQEEEQPSSQQPAAERAAAQSSSDNDPPRAVEAVTTEVQPSDTPQPAEAQAVPVIAKDPLERPPAEMVAVVEVEPPPPTSLSPGAATKRKSAGVEPPHNIDEEQLQTTTTPTQKPKKKWFGLGARHSPRNNRRRQNSNASSATATPPRRRREHSNASTATATPPRRRREHSNASSTPSTSPPPVAVPESHPDNHDSRKPTTRGVPRAEALPKAPLVVAVPRHKREEGRAQNESNVGSPKETSLDAPPQQQPTSEPETAEENGTARTAAPKRAVSKGHATRNIVMEADDKEGDWEMLPPPAGADEDAVTTGCCF